MMTLYSDFANTFSDRMFTTGCVTVFRYVKEWFHKIPFCSYFFKIFSFKLSIIKFFLQRSDGINDHATDDLSSGVVGVDLSE